ncbi:MAG: sensor histidine kinase [Lachnospiraceae bacterium]
MKENETKEEGKAEKQKKHGIFRHFSRRKIGSQLWIVYIGALFLPIFILGLFLMIMVAHTQKTHYNDLLVSYNDGVAQMLYEITSQINTISESIVYNDDLIDFLNGEYETAQEMRQAAAKTTLMDRYQEKYAGIEEIRVYIDREDMVDYGQFKKVTDEIRETDWYQKACEQYSPFWIGQETKNAYGNMEWNLTLVRKMVLVGGEREAVITIKVRNSYLGSRIADSKYVTLLAIDDQPVSYSNRLAYYGMMPEVPITYKDETYQYSDEVVFDGEESLVCLSTLKLSKTTNYLYLLTYDCNSMDNVRHTLLICGAVLLLALALPLLILTGFTRSFCGQVKQLRAEMGKASRGEYETMKKELLGSEELSETFEDLLVMVENIQKVEAEEYEARIKEKNIQNEQQKMEFKMLASQINPHFLYNTLETIRMKAFTAGDKEVATAIKLLGKSMRYVLENTGTVDTTLQKEYDHIVTYLQIQKLRFGDRVNYITIVQPDLDLTKLRILPLLLQPIVENGIVHGLEGKETDGCIWIAIYIKYGQLRIDISDNGCGIDAETLEKVMHKVENYTRERHTSSIGLYNINRRIKLNYGEEYGIKIYSTLGEGTRVRVILPVLPVEEDSPL